MQLFPILLAFVLLIPIHAAAQEGAKGDAAKGEAAKPAPAGELKIIDVKTGTGAQAAAGKAVLVQYTGWLYDTAAPKQRGRKFDSSLDRPGQVPFGFIVGVGKVIKGWDEGVAGMKVGGQRTLIIPASMAYGSKGIPRTAPRVESTGSGAVAIPKPGENDYIIPPDATLIFDIELLDVKG